MGKINMWRVLVGGMLAGLILNVGEAALHKGVLAKPLPKDLAMLVALTFAQGIVAVWFYAAIRPRFGPGPQTALCAGLIVWFLSAVYAAVIVYAGSTAGILPNYVVWMPVAWQFVQFPLATPAGAWLYRE